MDTLEKIYIKIEDRKINPKEGSYTNYLLAQGIDKVCKKVGEEAAETIIAAKNNNKEEIVSEISDLLYHILVLENITGVTVEDVDKKLKERQKIELNKKKENIRGEF